MKNGRNVSALVAVLSALACLGLFGTHQASAGDRLRLEPVGAYHSGIFDGGATEVIAYHESSRQVFAVNTHDNRIDIVSIADSKHPQHVGAVSLTSFGSLPTSVSSRDDILAASVLSKDGTTPGRVAFFTPAGQLVGVISVGWHPDMVMFTPDGKHLIVANEGEPTPDGKVDGEGSVSVVAVPRPFPTDITQIKVNDAGFQSWNDQPLPPGVRVVNRNVPFSKDAEPEGIAISKDSKTAYVSLQENDAVAVVDVATAKVTRLFGLGYKDHSVTGNEIDTSGREDGDRIVTCPVRGMYQPDNVGWLQVGAETYLVLADEGDSRGNDAFEEGVFLRDAKLDPEKFPNAAQWQADDQYGNVMVSITGDTDGDGDLDELNTFGSRSMSVISASDGHLVYDSGCRIERLIADRLNRFRQSHPGEELKYKVKKGPEPEGLTIGELHGHVYAFVGLERDNGIVTFDVTDPAHAELVDYCNPLDFEDDPADIKGDIGPEGLVYVGPSQSPTGEPLLLVANEVSGSVTIYAIRVADDAVAQVEHK